MVPIDINVPFVLASLLFLVICLLVIGIVVQLKQIHYRRGLIGKIQPADSTWTLPDDDVQPLALSGRSGNAFANFLSAIGVKVKPGKSADNADIKLKFLRAGLRGKNVPTVFWGTKFFLAVTLPMTFLIVIVLFFQAL